jgi:hypothetical protein
MSISIPLIIFNTRFAKGTNIKPSMNETIGVIIPENKINIIESPAPNDCWDDAICEGVKLAAKLASIFTNNTKNNPKIIPTNTPNNPRNAEAFNTPILFNFAIRQLVEIHIKIFS